jgi:hypothetical protein
MAANDREHRCRLAGFSGGTERIAATWGNGWWPRTGGAPNRRYVARLRTEQHDRTARFGRDGAAPSGTSGAIPDLLGRGLNRRALLNVHQESYRGDVGSEEAALEGMREEIERINAVIQACPGWAVVKDLRSVAASVRIFLGNHDELDRAIGIIKDPARWLPIVDIRNREAYGRFMDELDRLLHNYFASAYSLSSCMNKIRERRWRGHPAEAEYFSRTPYLKTGLPAFMFGLRHATQHERVPLTWSGMHGWRDERGELVAEDFFALSLDDLRSLNWNRTRDKGAYLDSLAEDPRLDSLLSEFTSELWQFSKWFEQELRRVYREELEEVEALNAELTAIGKRLNVGFE